MNFIFIGTKSEIQEWPEIKAEHRQEGGEALQMLYTS